MAASEKTLTHCAINNCLAITTSNNSNYVDLNDLLDLRLDKAKTTKVSFTGEANRLAIIKSTRSTDESYWKDKIQCVRFPSAPKLPIVTRKCVNLERWRNDKTEEETDTETSDSIEESRTNHENFTELCEELELKRTSEDLGTDGDLEHARSYFSEKSESDDEVSVVITDYRLIERTGDEAHYISTHEIEIAELDHDVDSESVTPTNWDIDDDHQVYSFLDYASFDSDETINAQEESSAADVPKSPPVICNQAESYPADTKCATSDEKVCESQNQSGGHIHLSIKATSKAINEPSNVQEKDGVIHHSMNTGDMSRCVFKAAKSEKFCDGAKCLIALPGRLHFGTKGKDVTGYSSGTSSAASELDDADKEVRNLTAKAFKSLAYPYLDAINFSTSSESSTSEHGRGINGWSLVDLKYSNVNVSKAGNKNMVTHQSATSNIQLAKRRECNEITGLSLTSRRAPPVEIFALNGSLMNPKNASSTQKIELMGNFAQNHSGVIRLTETLNFRCNVKTETPANEWRVKSSRGSRSSDEITNARSGVHNKPPCNSEEAMEEAHKKSIFASSLLKNVISKKMQFEQERKMERGEICEPCGAPSPCTPIHEHEPQRSTEPVHRQNSKLSETGSHFTIICLDELGDMVDSGSCDTKDDERHLETFALATETDLESMLSAEFDAKKGASEVSRSALIRSQNSAFRSWRDDELDVQAERKNEQTSPDSTNGKLTKMSHLFVPSIQPLSGERTLAKPEPCTNYDRVDREAMNSNLHVSDSDLSAGASKSPEIKISLRSLREGKTDPLSIAKLFTPNIAGHVKAADESKYQALTAALKNDSSDRIPQFTVRDVRDKGKMQAPIHQVRDVRKLVKSSYHFVSLDSNENKTNGAEMEQKTSKQNPNRNLSPIVIKCQSVNTNSNVKQSGNSTDSTKQGMADEIPEQDGSYPLVPTEGIKTSVTQINKPTGRMPVGNINHEGHTGLRIEESTTTRKQDKVGDSDEKKVDSKTVAFEKLQAAVKTMEQLYTFDKNEWKRKSKPRPVKDSHVLSLITSEEHRGTEQEQDASTTASGTIKQDSYPNPNKILPPVQQSHKEDTGTIKTSHTPAIHGKHSGSKSLMHLGGTSKKNTARLSHDQKFLGSVKSSSTKTPDMHGSAQVSISSKAVTHKSPRLPVKITQPKSVIDDRETLNSNEAGFTPVHFTSDSGNYITIPVKPHATAATHSHLKVSSNTKNHGDSNQSSKCSNIVMETRSPDTPTASIYHHPLPISMQPAQPQVICFSPTVQPSPIPTDHYYPTQRKMLLDPTTGNYYLVDTPVQPATRRLYDPETGQYVDVPMPQQPPMTPVPMPMSPLALSPGAYGHPYMFYPGYMATTVIPTRTIQSQLSMKSEGETEDKCHTGQQGAEIYMESPYYMPTGKSLHSTQGAPNITTGNAANSKVPVISITSQQGPRIIAPPTFDGTTMSFVVEHR